MMTKNSTPNQLIILCILQLFSLIAAAQISLETPNFIHFNTEACGILEAGADFQNQFETASDAIVLSVAILPNDTENVFFRTWRIDVSRNDIDWHPNLNLAIKRTGNGSSDFDRTVQSGEFYQKIEQNNNFFFNGIGWINSIPLQLELSGISVVLPAKSYATEIIFTLTDD